MMSFKETLEQAVRQGAITTAEIRSVLNEAQPGDESCFLLLKMKSSWCTDCYDKDEVISHVTLLTHEDGSKPSFFICWRCQSVGEVGVGPVRKETP